MKAYKTPGVYVEEKSVLASSVAGVSTAVPAFIGYTEKAGNNGELKNKPTKVKTLKEYVDLFGTIIQPTTNEEKIKVTVTANTAGNSYSVTTPELKYKMYYSLQMFFDNGGEACYIVSAGTKSTAASAKDELKAALNTLELEDEPTLIVPVDGSILSDSDYYDLCKQVLTQCNKMQDRFGLFDVPEGTVKPKTAVKTADAKAADKTADETPAVTKVNAEVDAANFRTGIGKNYLKYGAAYYPYLQTTLQYEYQDSNVIIEVKGAKTAAADAKTPPTALDGYGSGTEEYNAIKKAIAAKRVVLPPGSAVAGLFASVDRDRGVWKSPANVSFTSVSGPTLKLTEAENDGFNVDAADGKSINAIRSFTGKGTLIWGARTLAGNDNEWRYIAVRRLFNYIEESIQKATAYAVFEPNNAMTWLKLRSMIESFLEGLWRQGALAGGKAEDAYFVQVGLGTTMTSQDILEGRLIIKVGLAAVRPAEFIILEFTHKVQDA